MNTTQIVVKLAQVLLAVALSAATVSVTGLLFVA